MRTIHLNLCLYEDGRVVNMNTVAEHVIADMMSATLVDGPVKYDDVTIAKVQAEVDKRLSDMMSATAIVDFWHHVDGTPCRCEPTCADAV